jgi:hypothetical protein
MERNKHKSGSAGEEEKQNGKDQNRPAGPQALAAEEGPVYPAQDLLRQRGSNGFRCAGRARIRSGWRPFP